MPLPKRASPYILILLLILLLVLVSWMFKALTSPELAKAVREKAAKRAESQDSRAAQP